jgi:hypothetical protein
MKQAYQMFKSSRRHSQDLSGVSDKLERMEIEQETGKEQAENSGVRKKLTRFPVRRIQCRDEDLEALVSSQGDQDEWVSEAIKKLVKSLIKEVIDHEVEEN